ncbi:unnamed protein product [Pylaiella littoralis]
MTICVKCSEPFSDQSKYGIRLTLICVECAASTQLVTKRSAMASGARSEDLDNFGHRRHINPCYRRAAPSYLFIGVEVNHIADIANGDREAREMKRRSDAESKAAAKRTRQDEREQCRQKRIQGASSRINTKGAPAPGLVSGDFLTIATKTPKVSITKLSKRVKLWGALGSEPCVSTRVNLFHFACHRGIYSSTPGELESDVEDLHHALDKVVLTEGHRLMTFLTPMERFHLCRAVPSAAEESRELQVTAVCDGLYDLCQHASEKLADPEMRKRVLGRTSNLNWAAVHAFFVSKRGQIIPGRIERYGVSRVFDMICTETPERKRRQIFDCIERLGLEGGRLHHRVYAELLEKYVKNHRLVDFECIEHIIRIFGGWRILQMNASRQFDLLFMKMNRMVYEEGKTWGEAADGAADGLVPPGWCKCGHPSAKHCVASMCRKCCRASAGSSVVCIRHN